MKTTPVGSWTTPEARKGLSEKLVMRIFVGNYKNTGIAEVDNINDTNHVKALVEDMEFSVESQYNTPFSQSDPQSKLPTITALLQSGTLIDAANSLGFGEEVAVENQEAQANELYKTVQGMTHKSSFSKVNSTQLYDSSSSIRISGTLLLVAWDDAKEVENALKLLQAWALPSYLSDDLATVRVAQGASDGWQQGGMLDAAQGALDGLFNSVNPPIVSILYGGKAYHDFHIESVSAPMSAPMNANGDRIAVRVNVNFISRKAWDRANLIKLYGGS